MLDLGSVSKDFRLSIYFKLDFTPSKPNFATYTNLKSSLTGQLTAGVFALLFAVKLDHEA